MGINAETKNRLPGVIVFDLFGVLISEGHLVRNALKPLLPDRVDPARVKPAYQRFNLAQINEQEFWQSIGLSDYFAVRQTFLQSFRLDPDYRVVVNRLRGDHRLAILSNLPPDWADELLARFDLADEFSPILFSGHERCKKPDQKIYRLLIERCGVGPQDILFIDDRLENLAPAQALRMQTVHYEREPDAQGFKPDFRITRLAELLNLDA